MMVITLLYKLVDHYHHLLLLFLSLFDLKQIILYLSKFLVFLVVYLLLKLYIHFPPLCIMCYMLLLYKLTMFLFNHSNFVFSYRLLLYNFLYLIHMCFILCVDFNYNLM